MAAYDLEEQEQLAELKAWWKQYGNLLVNVLTAISVVVLAWQGWNWYQRSQSAQASLVYSALQRAAQEGDSQRVKAASGELLEKFARSSYAPLGALTAAKAMLDAGDPKTAKLQLSWVAENAKDEIRDIGRVRLVAVLMDEKAYEQAIKVLDGGTSPGFEPRFSALRGDVLMAQGKKTEAATSYRAALAMIEDVEKTAKARNLVQGWQTQSNAVSKELLQQRIDAIGGEKP